MRVLVTGASGFVGRGLVPYLESKGHQVVACTRHPSSIRAYKVVQIAALERDTSWTDALPGVEAVVHLAARAHLLADAAADPATEHTRVNVDGTHSIAEQAASKGVRKFIFLSSIGVLGNDSSKSRTGAFTEEDPPNPHDAYSNSKLEAERLLQSMWRSGLTVIRPPLIYGPGAPGNFGLLLRSASVGRPLPLGSLRAKRSLLSRTNLCSAIAAALNSDTSEPTTCVLAEGEDLSVADLYEKLCKTFGHRPWLPSVPQALLRAGLTLRGKRETAARLCNRLQVDASKFRSRFGWVPEETLDEGLRSAVLAHRGLGT